MAKNVYGPKDPRDRAGKAPVAPKKAWTQGEQTERLNGYLEISPEYWDLIRYGTHVRYYTKADGYRPGGFVLKNPLDAKEGGKRFMKLQNGFNPKLPGYMQWVVAYDTLERVYAKPDASVHVLLCGLEDAVKKLNANIKQVATYVKKIETHVAAVETRLTAIEGGRR